jgi:hypothetical protein
MAQAARHASDADIQWKPKIKRNNVDWRLEENTSLLRSAYSELMKRSSAAPGAKVKLIPFLRDFSKEVVIPLRTFKRFVVNGGQTVPSRGRNLTLVHVLEERMVTFAKFRYVVSVYCPIILLPGLCATITTTTTTTSMIAIDDPPSSLSI